MRLAPQISSLEYLWIPYLIGRGFGVLLLLKLLLILLFCCTLLILLLICCNFVLLTCEFLINTTLIFSLFFIFINLKICEADNENEVCNLLLATIKCFGDWLLPDVSFECWHCIFYFLLLTLLFYFGPAKCKPLLWFLSFSLSVLPF